MPKMEAVEYPAVPRVTAMTSLVRALFEMAYHSSRFSVPVFDTRTLFANVRWAEEMLETLIDEEPI